VAPSQCVPKSERKEKWAGGKAPHACTMGRKGVLGSVSQPGGVPKETGGLLDTNRVGIRTGRDGSREPDVKLN